MNKILFILFAGIVLMTACKDDRPPTVQQLETAGITAQGPYLSKDHKGNAVLCWTEQGADSLNRLKYAVYDQQLNEFGPSVTVGGSAGCSTAAESMGKVAFKDDGTVVAVFSKRFLKEKNPYAGAIYYTLSADSGKSWAPVSFLHTDTAHTYGRSFFDIARLKDGELAAVWLDGRFGKTIKGSALFFSITEKGRGFGMDTCLDKGTCECCRTDILTDADGNIHLAYRSILFPEMLSGKQVRDMVYKVSADNGKTFSETRQISNDHWEIEGCPHSGPSLAVSGNTTQAVWFTAAGGNSGLYCSSATPLGEKGFGKRSLLTASGRHPQMVSLSGGKTGIVYEEIHHQGHEGHTADEMKAGHAAAGMMHQGPAGIAKIVLQLLDNGKPQGVFEISEGLYSDNHAVLIALDNGALVAWVREDHAGSKIYYTKVKL